MKETEQNSQEPVEIILRSDYLKKTVDNFIKHLESLADTYPLVVAILKGTSMASQKRFNDFLKAECTAKDETETSYTVPIEKINKSKQLRRKVDNTALAAQLIPRNFVVSLLSEFDTYIGHIVKAIFYLKPELLNASEKNLSFSKLLELENVESAREYIIEKEIETILRDSHSQQFKWLENKIDTKLTVDLKSWKPFIELTERRNLFVHNDGIVNTQYLSVCKANGVELSDKIKLGSRLRVTENYFLNAYRCVFDIGVKLSQVIWRKFIPEETLEADTAFISIIYDQIVRNENKLAIELSEFATHKVIKHHNQDTKLTCIINKAQAYKWNGNNEKCDEIISDIDWSACSDKFKLVSFALTNDFDKAAAAMQKIGSNDEEITKEALRDWPVFREFRDSEQFLECYKKLFGIKYEKQEIEDGLLLQIKEENISTKESSPPDNTAHNNGIANSEA